MVSQWRSQVSPTFTFLSRDRNWSFKAFLRVFFLSDENGDKSQLTPVLLWPGKKVFPNISVSYLLLLKITLEDFKVVFKTVPKTDLIPHSSNVLLKYIPTVVSSAIRKCYRGASHQKNVLAQSRSSLRVVNCKASKAQVERKVAHEKVLKKAHYVVVKIHNRNCFEFCSVAKKVLEKANQSQVRNGIGHTFKEKDKPNRDRRQFPNKNSISSISISCSDPETYLLRRILLGGNVETNPGPGPASASRSQGVQNRTTKGHDLQVTTYNVRGLGDENKLRHLINLIYKNGPSKNSDLIFCLQETYVTAPGKIPYLWRGNYHLTPGTGSAIGCVTLLSSHLNVIEAIDVDGRAHILALQRSVDSQVSYIIANIYAPNKNNSDKLEFLENVFDKVSEFSERFNCKNTLLLGDFNLVFKDDETKNRCYRNQEKRIASCVKDFADALDLADIWNDNTGRKSFTWRRPNTDCFSTIDRIFYPNKLLKSMDAKANWSFSFSDHAAVIACFDRIEKHHAARSRITRLDPSLAKSKRYGPIIIQEYQTMLDTAPVAWDPNQKLEFAKMCIRTVVEKVQADRKRQEVTEEEALNAELETATNKLSSGQSRNPNLLIDHIESLRAQKSVIIEEKGTRLAEKLGTKWYNEGEKSTRYFMRLLNRSNPDNFEAIIREDGSLVETETEIEAEIVTFYKKLYEEKKNVTNQDDLFFDQVDPISDEEDIWITEPLTVESLRDTLHTCQDYAPGPDGIPYSYLGLLWASFGKILCDAWNFSLAKGVLPPSHKTSFLKLIPKAGKDLKKLTNWRPITLSNCDHKLITKTYAKKLCDKLASKIGERQTAYLKGRLINDNIRGIVATADLLERDDQTGLVVSLDAKKAFDSVDHKYIETCLKKIWVHTFRSHL